MKKIDRLLNLVTALAFLATLVLAYLWLPAAYRNRFPPKREFHDFKVGQVASLPGLPQNGLPTFVVAVLSSCPHCKDDLPLYHRLAQMPAVGAHRLNLVVMAPPRPDGPQVLNWWAGTGVPIAMSLQPAWKFEATPTVLHLDKNGRIQNIWRGSLSVGGKMNEKNLKEVLTYFD